jgi:uncharacterized protein (DUF1697 family)
VRQVLLLRGVNLGPARRVPMAALRELLNESGYEEVRTYVQSGNVVVSSKQRPRKLESEVGRLISERFGFEVEVVARTRDELAAVLKRNPLRGVVTNPKRYQVSFLSAPLSEAVGKRLHGLVAGSEALAIDDREVYAWHPEGVARSKLSKALGGKALGVTATSRNWTTVETLLQMADD